MSSSTPNGPSGATTPSAPSPANASGARSQPKMSNMGKSLDGQRKQAGSPLDASQQRYVLSLSFVHVLLAIVSSSVPLRNCPRCSHVTCETCQSFSIPRHPIYSEYACRAGQQQQPSASQPTISL